MKDSFAREMQDVQRRHSEQLDALNARCAELETANRKLRDIKYELDTKVSELSHRSGTAEGKVRSLEDEAARLRNANQQLALERHDKEVASSEFKSRLTVLDEKATAQLEIIEQQKSRTRDLEMTVRQLEGRCADQREVSAGHEQRAKEAQAEVVKGNQIIEKLSNDLKLLKEKIKRKQAIIVRQEEELQSREQALANDERELRSTTQALESSKAEVLDLRSEIADLRSKLEDSKGQLQSNEQMIRWLNQQVTEAQLSSTSVVPGSRYQYRPALPGPTVGAPAAIKPYTPSGSPGTRMTPAPPAFASATAARFAANLGSGATDFNSTPATFKPAARTAEDSIRPAAAAAVPVAFRYSGR